MVQQVCQALNESLALKPVEPVIISKEVEEFCRKKEPIDTEYWQGRQ